MVVVFTPSRGRRASKVKNRQDSTDKLVACPATGDNAPSAVTPSQCIFVGIVTLHKIAA